MTVDYRKRYVVEFRYRNGSNHWYYEDSYSWQWRAKRKARGQMKFLNDLCEYRVVDLEEENQ